MLNSLINWSKYVICFEILCYITKYQPIIFFDVSSNKSFLLSSTLSPKETMKYEDGKEYPVYKIETSSESHPFYTGKGRIETKEGRVAKFRRKYKSK